MYNRIIVTTYSVHPDQKSSEAIVNKNWLDILSKKGSALYVISAFNNYSFKKGAVKLLKKHKANLLLYKASKSKGFSKLIYKLFNKLYKVIFSANNTFQEVFWVKTQTKILDKNIANAKKILAMLDKEN